MTSRACRRTFEFPSSEEREVFIFALQVLAWHQLDVTPSTSEITVFVGSWNVGNAPPQQSLFDWIPSSECDVYAIGAQECTYATRDGFESCEVDWFETVAKHVGPEHEVLCQTSLLEMRLVVFVRRSLRCAVSRLQVCNIGFEPARECWSAYLLCHCSSVARARDPRKRQTRAASVRNCVCIFVSLSCIHVPSSDTVFQCSCEFSAVWHSSLFRFRTSRGASGQHTGPQPQHV